MKKLTGLWIVLCFVLLINISVGYAQDELDLEAKAIILMEQETGQILYEKNADEKRSPASITKLMTYLLTMEALERGDVSLEDRVRISVAAAKEGGSSYQLKAGEEISLRELMDVMMIVSANDATTAVAEHVGGSLEQFLQRMNERAKEMGLAGSRFMNPNGMPMAGEGNQMTAKDIAILTRYIVNHFGDQVIPITSASHYENKQRNYSRENTNGLMKMIPAVDGLKTGYTKAAGYCLSSTMVVKGRNGKEHDYRLIGVVLGAASIDQRNQDSKKLLEYGAARYAKKTIVDQGEQIALINLWDMRELSVGLLAKEEITVFGLREGMVKDSEVTVLNNLPLYVKEGDKLGEMKVTLQDDQVITIDLISDRDVQDIPFQILIGAYWKMILSFVSQLFHWNI